LHLQFPKVHPQPESRPAHPQVFQPNFSPLPPQSALAETSSNFHLSEIKYGPTNSNLLS
jgi:hypothetical protein